MIKSLEFCSSETALKLSNLEQKLFSMSWDSSIIKQKINAKIDLFDRGHLYNRVNIDESYPDYILNNKEKLKEWII